MARRPRNAKLETRAARLALAVAKKPHKGPALAPGIHLDYRRTQRGGGRWIARTSDGRGGYWTKAFALADDFEDADGEHVLTFWQAQDKARALARGKDADSARPNTVAEAIDAYERDLVARGGSATNATRVRRHLAGSPTLMAKPVALLTPKDLRHFRDGLIENGVARPTVNRVGKALKAALTLTAKLDSRIGNREAWKDGLAELPGAYNARNVILADDVVRSIVAEAYAQDAALGLLVETAAVTGCRAGQLARLTVADLQDENGAPRLTMPSSRKGKNRKPTRKPVPITASLAAALAAVARGRKPTEALLRKRDGTAWAKSDHLCPFAVVTERVGRADVTLNALRHSSIVRALLAGVPTRVVAATHDTSVVMIERTYSIHIADHSDALTRRALLDTVQPSAANVVALPTGRRP